ncbi:MAG: hypothetical protein L6Q83_06630, partial [Gammaproteobacteria bacterium]|nr:hypothetical protein [Gammaproteobacteria bacterium]
RPRQRLDTSTLLGALAASALAVSLVVSAHNLLEARRLREQADAALGEGLAEEARARSLQESTPRLPLPADALRADLARLTSLQAFSTGLSSFLHRLAAALDTLPGVELSALEWSLPPDAPQTHAIAIVELRLPAGPKARPELARHVIATLHHHTGSLAQAAGAPDDQGPLRSPGGQGDADTRHALRVELTTRAP